MFSRTADTTLSGPLILLFGLGWVWFGFDSGLNPRIIQYSFSLQIYFRCVYEILEILLFFFLQFWGHTDTYLNLPEMRTVALNGRVTGN